MASRIRFDCFEVDLASGQLYRRGVRINLREKSFQVLAFLLERPGEVVTRDELYRRLWREEVFVDFESNLNATIARLREALNDSADRPRYIETLPKHGYRFLASTSETVRPSAPSQTRRTRLAVLPFVNLSGNSSEEYFSDAMTDDVISALANLAPETLSVIARTTAMRYKGSHKDISRIGRELKVDYILEGSVRLNQDRVTINVQLVQASDQAHVFARKYDSELRDIFAIQNCIAQAVVAQIPPTVGGLRAGAAAKRQARKPTEDIGAYQSFIHGRYYLNKYTPEGMAKAKQYFEEALARDANFALPHIGLAELYWYLAFYGFSPPKDACALGLFHALRAVEIDNSIGETHALIASFRKVPDYNWLEIQRELARALELSPASPVVRLRYAIMGLMPHGHLRQAISEIEIVLESDPLSLNTRLWLSILHWLARDFDRCVEQARLMLEIDSTNFMGHLMLGVGRTMQHFHEEAAAALKKAVELSGNSRMVLAWLGLALAQGGRTAEARALLQQLHAAAAKSYVPPSCFAWTHIGLGEIDEAFVWMDRAIDARDPMVTPIRSYCFMDPLRADPRFAALLRKMNLDS
ncbi:MAG TPA: FlgO family outer membrane protein [Terriglobia bacterium]|nr:FlgO family outer membrane protein [Terriglobia bacterium]